MLMTNAQLTSRLLCQQMHCSRSTFYSVSTHTEMATFPEQSGACNENIFMCIKHA